MADYLRDQWVLSKVIPATHPYTWWGRRKWVYGVKNYIQIKTRRLERERRATEKG